MPNIIKRGELADVAQRWPHNEKFTCPRCKTVFGITPQDTKDGFYEVKSEDVDMSDQRETYFINRLAIHFDCPLCGEYHFKEWSPNGWTLAFAKGITKTMERS